MLDQLQSLLDDHIKYHSAFQMDWFITTRAGITPYGMYKQAVREIEKRYKVIQEEMISMRETQIKLNELEDPVANLDESNRLSALRFKIQLSRQHAAMRDRVREFLHFYGQAIALKAEVGELTLERRDELEAEHWVANLKLQAASDLITNSRFRPGFIEHVWCLPDAVKTKLKEEIQDGKALIEWFWAERPELPKPVETTNVPSVDEVMELVSNVTDNQCRSTGISGGEEAPVLKMLANHQA